MPKELTSRRRIHQSSIKLNKKLVAQDHVQIGSTCKTSGLDIINPYVIEESTATSTKKEKHQAKREAFLQRVDPPLQYYSKSHNRRLRRKAKEEIIGGDMNELHTAIAALDDDHASDSPGYVDASTSFPDKSNPKYRKPRKIGEGKKNPLSKSQRKHALVVEQIRQPLILSNPEFSSNPFQTLRIHAQNTLSKHHISV